LLSPDGKNLSPQVEIGKRRFSHNGDAASEENPSGDGAGSQKIPDIYSSGALSSPSAFLGAVRPKKGADVLDITWMAEGKCREHPSETFFPSDGVGVEIAKRICAACPVRESCLEYALFHNIEHGVWGGASERARRRIARDRRSLARTSI
jgi:WhiB family redox-sensing transcriptional regulator